MVHEHPHTPLPSLEGGSLEHATLRVWSCERMFLLRSAIGPGDVSSCSYVQVSHLRKADFLQRGPNKNKCSYGSHSQFGTGTYL